MPSGEPGESGRAPAYGTYVGSRTPPTTTGVPAAVAAGAGAWPPLVGAAAAVGFAGATAVTVGEGTGGLVGAAVGAVFGAGVGAPHAANSGRPTEPAPSMTSTWRRVGRPLNMTL